MAYKDNPAKNIILSGNETEQAYEIHHGKGKVLSQRHQFNVLDDIDRKYFLCLLEADADYKPFSKYLLKNETRSLVSQLIGDEIDSPRERKPLFN